jgi:Xaa-Pro aminopeptidase
VDRVLYPHHVGHYLGLDVHDTHDLERSRSLKSGMVITIGNVIHCCNFYFLKNFLIFNLMIF